MGIKKHIKFYYKDTKKRFLILWSILILINVVTFILSNIFLLNIRVGINVGNNYSVVGGNFVTIAIYMFVIIILNNTETFKATMGFSSTRKDFYVGSIVFYVLLSVAMVLIQFFLFKIEDIIYSYMGLEKYIDFSSDVIKMFFILLLLSASVSLITIISYKIGYWIWGIISASAILMLSIKLTRIYIFNLLNFIFSKDLAYYCLNITIVSIIIFYIGWLCIRKIDLKIKS